MIYFEVQIRAVDWPGNGSGEEEDEEAEDWWLLDQVLQTY
jgi:hypothetical protein